MENRSIGIIAVVFLGFSIFISSIIVANSLNKIADRISNITNHNVSNAIEILAMEISSNNKFIEDNHQVTNRELSDRGLLNFAEAAIYLGLPYNHFAELIETKKIDIPYFTIDGNYYFGKVAIDDWIKEVKFQNY